MKEHKVLITIELDVKTEHELNDDELNELIHTLDYAFGSDYAYSVDSLVTEVEEVYSNKQTGM